MSGQHWRGRVLWAAGLVLWAVLGVWVLQQVQAFDWAEVLQRVPWAWWPVAVAAWLGAYGVRAWRLRREWAHRSLVPWGRCLCIVLRHNAAVLMLPMRLGEAGYVVSVVRQWGVSLREAAWSLLKLRLQDGVVLGALAVAALVPSGGWMSAGLALVILGLRWSWRPDAHRRGAPRQALRDTLVRVVTADGWGPSVLNWMLRLGVIAGWLLWLAPAPPSLAVAAAAGAELGALWPLQGPAGLGPFEAGAWLAARWMGATPPGLVAAALVAHVFCIGVALSAAAAALLVQAGAAGRERLRRA